MPKRGAVKDVAAEPSPKLNKTNTDWKVQSVQYIVSKIKQTSVFDLMILFF